MNYGPTKAGFYTDLLTKPSLFLHLWSQATLGEAVFISHPPHIVHEQGHMLPAHWPDWHGRQMVFWGGNEEFLHMHTWLMNKVWSLPTFFAEVLARRKTVLADGPFD